MIHALFQKDRPLFVRFDQNQFRIGRRRREQLQGFIVDMLPMRKRFEGKRVACWANDGVTGRYGQRCALCRERWSCAERVRLMLLLDGLEEQSVPAILEIGYGSFDALEQFVQTVGADNVASARVCIAMKRDNGRLRFTFQQAT
jgi:hypothetical protein